jgi:hypothetical protein
VFITDFKFSQAFATQGRIKSRSISKVYLKPLQVIANETVVQANATARSNVANLHFYMWL